MSQTVTRAVGAVVRAVGQWVDTVGVTLQGKEAYIERLVPSTRAVALKGGALKHGMQLFVASSATVVGDVSIGELSAVFYGATVRGDKGAVKIGRNVSIQDNAMVESLTGHPLTVIGDDVVIAPGAHIASATIDDGAMIGMGARLGPGVKVGKDAFVDGGAVVPEGTVIPPGQLWTGNPAAHLRDLSVDEMAFLRTQALTYGQVAGRHFEQSIKSTAELEYEEYLADWREWNYMKPEDPIPTVAPEMVEYYTLTRAQSVGQDQGIFREREYDDDAMRAAKLLEEAEADKAEEEYYQNLATLDVVFAGVKQLTDTRVSDAGSRAAVLEWVSGRDERAGIYLQDLLARVHEAQGDAAAEKELRDELFNLDPAVWAEAKGLDTDTQLGQLVGHAAAMAASEGEGLPAGGMAALAASLDVPGGDIPLPDKDFATRARGGQ